MKETRQYQCFVDNRQRAVALAPLSCNFAPLGGAEARQPDELTSTLLIQFAYHV